MAKEPAGIGDNSDGKLDSLVRRINSLLDDRDKIGEDLKELRAEIKGDGFNTKALMKAVAISRKDQEKWRAEQEELDLYLGKLGLI